MRLEEDMVATELLIRKTFSPVRIERRSEGLQSKMPGVSA